MSKTIAAIRGMNDIYQQEAEVFDWIIAQAKAVLAQYGYSSIHLPLVEKTELFARSIGEVTDIVEKEMYTFEDRSGDSLSLRPEGTAGCVRAMIQNGWLHNQTQKVFYSGPMFRHERPQKGRYRQFHQLGVEVFGLSASAIDAEVIILTARFWEKLGLENLELQLNSLGSAEARAAYRVKLVAYLDGVKDELDEDSLRRLTSNPLRILDSKNPAMQDVIAAAPKLIDNLDEESQEHFDQVCGYLDSLGIDYLVNPNLVRGLDYYNQTVFEWVTKDLGSQGTVCAGGRYDGLVEQLGGRSVPAVGFAMGLERLVALVIDKQLYAPQAQADVFIMPVGRGAAEYKAAMQVGVVIAEEVRDELSNLKVELNTAGGGFKSQFKRADRSGASLALILGEDEVAQEQVGVKFLREEREQLTLDWKDLSEFLQKEFN